MKEPKTHNTDCITFLQKCKEGSYDMIIADPPYSSGGMVRSDRNTGSTSKYSRAESAVPLDFLGDNRDQRSYLYWSQLWISESVRVLKDGGLVLIFTDWRQLPTTTDAIQAGGAVWRGIIPWNKKNDRPMSDRYSASCEYIVWGTKGARKVDMKDPGSKYVPGWYEHRPKGKRIHATEKPVELYRHIFQILRTGQKILDPFMGSGTSAIAAYIEGFEYDGCEMSKDIYEIACNRLKLQTAQTQMF